MDSSSPSTRTTVLAARKRWRMRFLTFPPGAERITVWRYGVETGRQLRKDIARAVHNGKECGEVAAELDPWPVAVRLAAVTEGLALQVYRDPAGVNGVSAAELSASVIASELATVFTGECRQYTKRARA
ncbi:TetR family transcriptional regulator C-terminal domain-containing protein [Streptomyces sp. 5-10]|nr:TetR family transcriptional regulator C-terminal domain-containing protein [Streptomyces sp. 5-10]